MLLAHKLAPQPVIGSFSLAEKDPPEVMDLRVLRDLVVGVSMGTTSLGRRAKAVAVELRKERFAPRPSASLASATALLQAQIFAGRAMAASGYGTHLPLAVLEDDPVVFHQMRRTFEPCP